MELFQSFTNFADPNYQVLLVALAGAALIALTGKKGGR